VGLITPHGEVLQQGWAYLQPGEHFEFTQWTQRFLVRVAPDVCVFEANAPLDPEVAVSGTTVDVTLMAWGGSGRQVVFWNSLVLIGSKDPDSGMPDGVLTLELATEKIGPGGRVQFSLYFQKDLDASEVTG